MKITYTAPNRAHHYPYAQALAKAGHLKAFVAGFSRLSPRAPLPSVGKLLKRHDFFQTLYLASLKFRLPLPITYSLNCLTNRRLDFVSYKWAVQSDVFIFYRTQGYETTKKLHKENRQTLCIVEEVNSHVESMEELMKLEFNRLNLGRYHRDIPDYDKRLETYALADYILCPSSFVKRSFINKGFNPEKIITVNFGFPVPIQKKSLEKIEKKDYFRVLYVGQIHYRKGLHYAIDAFKKLKHPNKEFFIVGPKTKVTGLENTSIPKEVKFLGELKGKALEEQFQKASVFVLPSIEEGLALVQGEALSFGLPLIITTNTGGDDLIVNGKQGFIVNPFDIESIFEKLQFLADNLLIRQQMSYEALETAQLLGSWDLAAQKLISELQKRINGVRNLS